VYRTAEDLSFFFCFLPFSDEDSNGEIDKEELKNYFQKLEISFTEEEISDLFEACDINEDERDPE
jgi:calcium-binding protein CML